jgi:prevent-host-death family protein
MVKSPPASVNIHDAKTQLSRLLARVEQGEEIVIARAGNPVARLVPIERPPSKRSLGRYAGLGFIADDFDAPLPPEILESFHS